ncbi:MAG: class I SAM-dependent methyltransferase [Methylococcaceae bacterium]
MTLIHTILSEEPQFPKHLKDWQTAPAEYTENKLTILNHPVMEDWETPYMEKLAEIATMKGGVILEIGFGMGLSASFIQRYPIAKHIVIEMNNDVFSRLMEFAKDAPSPVEPRLGLWQDILPIIPAESIDGILFDSYPLSADDLDCHYPFFVHAHRILKSGGVFTYYSDEAEDFAPEHLARLQEVGFTNITKELCAVNPPTDCLYWQGDSILAPIVIKS